MHPWWPHSSARLTAERRVYGNSGRSLARQRWREAGGVGSPLHEKKSSYCAGRVPIYVHPSFCRASKVQFSMDVGEVSRDIWVTTEISTGFLRQAVGIPNPENIPHHRGHWVGKWVRMTLHVTSLNARGLRDPSKCARLLGELSNMCVCFFSARDPLNLRRWLLGAGGWLCGLFGIQQPLQRWSLSTSWAQP